LREEYRGESPHEPPVKRYPAHSLRRNTRHAGFSCSRTRSRAQPQQNRADRVSVVGLLLIGHLAQLLRLFLLKRLRDLGFRFFLNLIKRGRRTAVCRALRDVSGDCVPQDSFEPRHHVLPSSEDPRDSGGTRATVRLGQRLGPGLGLRLGECSGCFLRSCRMNSTSSSGSSKMLGGEPWGERDVRGRTRRILRKSPDRCLGRPRDGRQDAFFDGPSDTIQTGTGPKLRLLKLFAVKESRWDDRSLPQRPLGDL